MGVEPILIQIRRGIMMVPVYEIPLDRVANFSPGSRNSVSWCELKSEVKDWLKGHGLHDDPYSDMFTWWDDLSAKKANFFFVDPKLAMLFKLTWA